MRRQARVDENTKNPKSFQRPSRGRRGISLTTPGLTGVKKSEEETLCITCVAMRTFKEDHSSCKRLKEPERKYRMSQR